MPAQAVMWDIDGTFALTEDLHFASLVEVSGRFGATLDANLQQRLIGLSAPDVYDFLTNHRAMKVDFAQWALERYQYYQAHADSIEPRPGALQVWAAIAQRGIRQCLVSNSDRLLVNINIKALGLEQPRLISVARNDVRLGKPDPEPYLRAAYLLGVDSGDCVAVEDTPTGATAALSAGMKTVICPEDFTLAFPAQGIIVEQIDQLLSQLDTQ